MLSHVDGPASALPQSLDQRIAPEAFGDAGSLAKVVQCVSDGDGDPAQEGDPERAEDGSGCGIRLGDGPRPPAGLADTLVQQDSHGRNRGKRRADQACLVRNGPRDKRSGSEQDQRHHGQRRVVGCMKHGIRGEHQQQSCRHQEA